MRSMNETQNARLMEVLRSICLFYLKLDLSEQLSVTRPYGMSDDEQTPLEIVVPEQRDMEAQIRNLSGDRKACVIQLFTPIRYLILVQITYFPQPNNVKYLVPS